jgi:hypothetical protein
VRNGADDKRPLTPVVLVAASPGTITGVITLAVAHAKLLPPVTVLIAVAEAALENVGRDGASVPIEGIRRTRRPATRHRDPIHGIDYRGHARPVWVDRTSRFSGSATLTKEPQRHFWIYRKFRAGHHGSGGSLT